MSRIFISYRQEDTFPQAMMLYGMLAEQLGKDKIFIDQYGIQAGENWLAKLKRELVRSDVQLVLIGPTWLTVEEGDGRKRLGMSGDILTLEVTAALECGATVIPVLLQGAKMPEVKDLPPDLERLALRQCVNIGKMTNTDEIEGLINVLKDLPEQAPDILGGCFHLEGHIGKTRHTDIYLAVAENEVRSFDPVVVHALRQDREEEVRNWFERYCTLWQRVSHPNVVVQHSQSDYQAQTRAPFFAISAYPGGQTLENEIQERGGLGRKRIVDVLKIASSICEAAHRRCVLLQSLEPAHFRLDANGELRYEGFDAAVALGENVAKEGIIARKYCVAPERLAPEVGIRRADCTVDIYALGMLLKAMELDTGQALERLHGNERRDPWNALVFHCLWVDPGGRFQHPAQFRHFLARCFEWQDYLPELAALEEFSGNGSDGLEYVSGKSRKYIGRTTVTNIEYEHFCIEVGYPLRCPDPNKRRVARRLQGPFCPVVDVNLNDAEKYCDWLSERTGQKWRLPTEAEWMRAAAGSERDLLSRGHEAAANCSNRFGGPTVVGAFNKSQSDIGCWDMLGNVWEWCSDRSEQSSGLRILKGSSYACSENKLSITRRQTAVRTYRASNVGFRVLKEE